MQANTNNMTTAEITYSKINEAITAGRTVYVSTMTNCTKITKKNVDAFSKAGYQLFSLDKEGCLRMQSGKKANVIATKSMLLVGIQFS